ncbi:MAG: hypothetical protein EBR40_02245 [Proteobacteria bacterium]|nr:hypothetical protein [Pseudomonadota bacterium]
MTTLLEIENAAETLPEPQQRELLLFLMERLRAKGPAIPQPRIFSTEQIQNWINEDEEDMRLFGDQ